MIHLRFFSLAAAMLPIVFAGGCSCETQPRKVYHPKSDYETVYALHQFVRIHPNNMLYLDLSHETAVSLGISDDWYNKMIESIESANAFTKAISDEPNSRIHYGFYVPPTLPRIPDYMRRP